MLVTLAVIAGPSYSVSEYSALHNLISELAAQNTPRNWLMASAFMALGAGIVIDGWRKQARHLWPFIAFGMLMALAGLFGHRPLSPTTQFVGWVHEAHSALATGAGISITLGFLWQSVRQQARRQRLVSALMAFVCVIFPLAMLWWPDWQGITQRAMYCMVFLWLWLRYPEKTDA